jgi:hypothetical protein
MAKATQSSSDKNTALKSFFDSAMEGKTIDGFFVPSQQTELKTAQIHISKKHLGAERLFFASKQITKEASVLEKGDSPSVFVYVTNTGHFATNAETAEDQKELAEDFLKGGENRVVLQLIHDTDNPKDGTIEITAHSHEHIEIWANKIFDEAKKYTPPETHIIYVADESFLKFLEENSGPKLEKRSNVTETQEPPEQRLA